MRNLLHNQLHNNLKVYTSLKNIQKEITKGQIKSKPVSGVRHSKVIKVSVTLSKIPGLIKCM